VSIDLHRGRLWQGAGAFLLMACALFVGCKEPAPPRLAPVRGVVLYRHRPVASVQVQFVPEAEGQPHGTAASAWTAADGTFSLRSHPHGDGAAPGVYRVQVVPYPGGVTLPEIYADPAATPLRATVPEQGLENHRIVLSD
jgi:hypothetical protein